MRVKYFLWLVALALFQPLVNQSYADEPVAVPRIIGGAAVNVGQYPWMVSLQFVGANRQYVPSHFCGGFQINANWIVSAAHCFTPRQGFDYSADQIVAVIGNVNVSSPSAAQMKSLDQVIVHQGYNDNSNEHDIALLHLQTPNSLNSYVDIASESLVNNLSSGQALTVAGWGYIDNNQTQPNSLQSASVDFVSESLCKRTWGNLLTANMLCASGGFRSDSCQGDSGGPLWYQDGSGNEHVVGVVSFGSRQCADGVPSVYAKLPNYLGWIRDNTVSLSISSPHHFGLWPQHYEHQETLTVTNHNSAAITITNVRVTGSAFRITSERCSNRLLAAGNSCSVDVIFTAGSQPSESGTLSVQTATHSVTSSLTGRSAQALALSNFSVPAELALTSYDSGLIEKSGELSANLSELEPELEAPLQIEFLLQAKASGTASIQFSTQGSENQMLTVSDSPGRVVQSVSGLQENRTLEFNVTTDDILHFSFLTEDKDDAFTLHSVAFVTERAQPSSPSNGNEGGSSNRSSSGGGGGFSWLTSLSLAVLFIFRRFNRVKPFQA